MSTPADAFTVIGIDASRTHMGVALLRVEGMDTALVDAETLNLTTATGQARFRALLATAAGMGCRGLACERNCFTVAHGRGERVGQAIRRGQARAQGTVEGFAAAFGLPILPPVAASSGKKALSGSGRATKDMMIAFARHRYQVELDEHAADACGVALCAARRELGGR